MAGVLEVRGGLGEAAGAAAGTAGGAAGGAEGVDRRGEAGGVASAGAVPGRLRCRCWQGEGRRDGGQGESVARRYLSVCCHRSGADGEPEVSPGSAWCLPRLPHTGAADACTATKGGSWR